MHKRLTEAASPLKEVSEQSAREKSIRGNGTANDRFAYGVSKRLDEGK